MLFSNAAPKERQKPNTILLVNVFKRKMMNFYFIQKKVSNSRAIGNFYFEVEGEKAHFYWADLQVKWYNSPFSPVPRAQGFNVTI